jgi:hypothetical protein
LGGDPERVGPYQVLGRLGAGGMGTVFLARCGDGPPVAVKVLRPELSRDPSFLRLFRHEVDAARRVVGFCTARVLDADLSGPLPYLVTEYVEGVRLDRAVAGSGGLAATDLEGLAVGMAAAAAGRWLPEPAALPRAMDDHEFRGGCTARGRSLAGRWSPRCSSSPPGRKRARCGASSGAHWARAACGPTGCHR